jgi:hypothetical protein
MLIHKKSGVIANIRILRGTILKIVKHAQNIHLKMEQNITDNGKQTQDMDTEHKFGQMVLNTRGTGKIIKHMVRELFYMFMEINM